MGQAQAREGALKTFSSHFKLGKTQAELDFVDIPTDGDVPLFIDPYAISRRNDRWSRDCHHSVVHFFESVVQAIRGRQVAKAKRLLLNLREPNETHFGYSKSRPRGAGIGSEQAKQLYNALAESSAVKTGFLTSLEEAELMVEGVSFDNLSDLTTNIICLHLCHYTQAQCDLHGIPTAAFPLPPYYDRATGAWESDYHELPAVDGKPVLLVPKVIARFSPAYNHAKYYQHYVLNYLQSEHLKAGTSLVRTFKNGRRSVYKKDIAAIFPGTKENLFAFSKEHPQTLLEYRDDLARIEAKKDSEVEPEDEEAIAQALVTALKNIPAGSAAASEYHRMMTGVVEFVFFPSLLYPQKEREIHSGRKRIDIVMENGARDGAFERLEHNKRLPCAYVAFECKNYTTEVANPELDQLAGRFSMNRGQIGFLLCRRFENRDLFVRRCQDTLKDGRGLIVPVDDETVIRWLRVVSEEGRKALDAEIGRAIDEIWMG